MNSVIRYFSVLFFLVPLRFFGEDLAESKKAFSLDKDGGRYFSIGSIDVVGVDDQEKLDNILSCFAKSVGDIFDVQDYSSINAFKEKVLSKCTFVNDYVLTYSTHEDVINLCIKVTTAPLINNVVSSVKGNDEDLEKIKGKKYANEVVLQELMEDYRGNADLEDVDLVVKVKEDSEAATSVEVEKIEKAKTYVNVVSFVGNDHISSKELLSSLSLAGKDVDIITFLRDTYDAFKLDMTFLKSRGEKLLTFFAQKGKKTLLKKILKADLNIILEKYYSRGFLNAKIKQLIINYDKENDYCDITYVIEEGECFYVGGYEVSETKPYSSFLLKKVLDIRPGDVFDAKTIHQKVFGSQDNMYLDGIKTLFNRAGYNNCSFSIKIRKISGNKVYFYIDIREGTREVVGEIIVNGNFNTSFKYFLEDSTMLPNNFYSSIDVMRTQQSLAQNKAVDSRNPPVVLPVDMPMMMGSRSLFKNIVFLVQEKSFIEPKTGNIQFRYIDNFWLHILPYGNIAVNFVNLNLFKFLPWNWYNRKVRWLGKLHDLSISFNFDFMDKDYDWFWHGLFNINYFIPELVVFGYKFSNSANIRISALPPSKKKEEMSEIVTKRKGKITSKITSVIIRELSYSFSLSFGTRVIMFGKSFSLSFLPLSVKISSDLENCKMEDILILRHRTFRSDFYVYKGVDLKLSFYMPTFLGKAIDLISSSKVSFRAKQCAILYYSQYFNPFFKDFVFMYSIVTGLSVGNSCFAIKGADQTDGTWGDYYKYSKNVTDFYIRGMHSEDSVSGVKIFENNFAIKFNVEFRYLVLEKMLFNAYIYVFVNNGYAGNIKKMFKKASSFLQNKAFCDLLDYSGVGFLITIPLIGELSLSIAFKDMLLTMTYGVENQNV